MASQEVIGIDPGNKFSAWVVVSALDWSVRDLGYSENEWVRNFLSDVSKLEDRPAIAVEMMGSFGKPVGAEVFETCVWIGRFVERFGAVEHQSDWRVYRNEVITHFCGSRTYKVIDPETGEIVRDERTGRAKLKGYSDSQVRSVVKDRYGGSTKAVGGKKCGACHGKGGVGHERCPVCGEKKRCGKCKGKGEECGFCCPACHGGRDRSGYRRAICQDCEGSGFEVKPGPLYRMTEFPNVNTHIYQALAVALFWMDLHV